MKNQILMYCYLLPMIVEQKSYEVAQKQNNFEQQQFSTGSSVAYSLIKYFAFPSLDNIKTLVLLDKSLSPRALSLINHKLSKLSHFKHQNVQPLVFSSLLHLLPIMAKDKCCIGSVLSLINSFSSTPTFAALRLGLLYELW